MDVEKAIKDKFSAEGLPVGVSIGTTIYDGGELDIEKLIHESDERMYEIKKKHHEAAKDKR
jgi:GGDEF domain-containing protein